MSLRSSIVAPLAGPLQLTSFEALQARIGSTLGCSSWATVSQPAIDAFAALTGDVHPAHVDTEAARRQGGATMAHGFLTLSLMAHMAYEVCQGIEGTVQTFNYGFDRVRFIGIVPCGSRVRACFRLAALMRPQPGRWLASYDVETQVEGASKPALVARWMTMGVMQD